MMMSAWSRALAALLSAGVFAAGCETFDEAVGGAPAPIETPEAPAPPPDPRPTFDFVEVGALEPGSGDGTADRTIYAPDMTFPVRDLPTFINSQVYRPGGSQVGGDQCSQVNFDYPWLDNFCEIRSSDRTTLNCPQTRVHQGQDLRAGDVAMCLEMRNTPPSQRTQIPVVAVEDGVISYIGKFTVNLRAGNRIYRYMHLNMQALEVERGQPIEAGQLMGYLSNDFGGAPTTFHLHFEIKQNIDGVGWTWVNPYMSLVRAYERDRGFRAVEQPIDPPVEEGGAAPAL